MSLHFSRVAAFVLACFIASCSGDRAGEPKGADTAMTADDSVQTQAGGVMVSSVEGRFSIRMPEGFSNPREGRIPLVADGDTTMMTSYTVERDSTAFVVAFTEMRAPQKLVNAGQVFDMARDASLRNISGTLERQESLMLNGYPGRSIFFTGTMDSVTYSGRADFYLAMPRLYQLYYISSDRQSVNSPAVSASFSSFRLMDSAAATP